MFNNRIKYRPSRDGLVMSAPHPITKESQKLVIGGRAYLETTVVATLAYAAIVATSYAIGLVLVARDEKRQQAELDAIMEENRKAYEAASEN